MRSLPADLTAEKKEGRKTDAGLKTPALRLNLRAKANADPSAFGPRDDKQNGVRLKPKAKRVRRTGGSKVSELSDAFVVVFVVQSFSSDIEVRLLRALALEVLVAVRVFSGSV
jgi:hypothetical protein